MEEPHLQESSSEEKSTSVEPVTNVANPAEQKPEQQPTSVKDVSDTLHDLEIVDACQPTEVIVQITHVKDGEPAGTLELDGNVTMNKAVAKTVASVTRYDDLSQTTTLSEPHSRESAHSKSSISGERSAAEEEILSTIENVEDWAEEEESEEEEEGEHLDDEEKNGSVDGDRDRKNPQYIPRSGPYYLHDDRTEDVSDGDGEESNEENDAKTPSGDDKQQLTETVAVKEVADQLESNQPQKAPPVRSNSKTASLKKQTSREPEKKLSRKAEDPEARAGRWEHDLFDVETQSAKSHNEIHDRYGYNIRDDEQAPRGRRNRRYGRPSDGPGQRRPRGRGFSSGRGRGRGGPPAAPRRDTEPEFEDSEPVGKENVAVEKEGVNDSEDGNPADYSPKHPENRSRAAPPPRRASGRPPKNYSTGPREPAGRRGGTSTGYNRQSSRSYHDDRYEGVQESYAPPPPRFRGGNYTRVPPVDRSYQADYPPRRYQQQEYDDGYDLHSRGYDGYDRADNSAFQSRVFFSRGRGPRRGGPLPPPPQPFRGGAGVPSREPIRAAPEPRYDVPPQTTALSRGGARNYEMPRREVLERTFSRESRGSGSRLDRPPAVEAPEMPAQSKRYSSRRNPNVRAPPENEASGDVRASGAAQHYDYPAYQNPRGAVHAQQYPGNYVDPRYSQQQQQQNYVDPHSQHVGSSAEYYQNYYPNHGQQYYGGYPSNY